MKVNIDKDYFQLKERSWVGILTKEYITMLNIVVQCSPTQFEKFISIIKHWG
jgi:hypothetical protein